MRLSKFEGAAIKLSEWIHFEIKSFFLYTRLID